GFSYLAVFHNFPLVAALLGFAIAQSIKFFLTRYKEKRWDPKRLIGSGGMPSSHSATVTALSVAIGFQEGFGSALFATSTIFASVVMYDASGVRLHAGKQAAVCNNCSDFCDYICFDVLSFATMLSFFLIFSIL
uniref:Uncharacterized protein n=1 Tax=Aegilops tauschii subsp. strangulata TaxID=200361 RepID=A0A453G466_AEGTS